MHDSPVVTVFIPLVGTILIASMGTAAMRRIFPRQETPLTDKRTLWRGRIVEICGLIGFLGGSVAVFAQRGTTTLESSIQNAFSVYRGALIGGFVLGYAACVAMQDWKAEAFLSLLAWRSGVSVAGIAWVLGSLAATAVVLSFVL